MPQETKPIAVRAAGSAPTASSVTPSSFDDAFSIVSGDFGQNLPVQSLPDQSLRPSAESSTPPRDDGFDENRYLIAFPDIADAIRGGDWASGLDHYLNYGAKEGRLTDLRYLNASQTKDTATFPAGGLDASFVSRSGWCLVIGWLNDETVTLRQIACMQSERIVGATSHFARCRREDAEGVVSVRPGKLLGFWTVFHIESTLSHSDPIHVRISAGREQKTFLVIPSQIDEEKLREVALEYLASSRYYANPQAEAILQLKDGLGKALVDYNTQISKTITAGAYVTRYGPQLGKPDGSVIVCLYGRAEYLFLQASLFSGCPGADRYEFIYVSNSPELAEKLLKEAAMAARIYAIRITIVILPSNAGFGAANNIAVEHALSDRILITNPDVFPRDRGWANQHSAVVADLPAEQTAIFGAPLFYDDGSLMHAGMFFDIDTGISIRDGRIERHEMIRVEHYAKGAPPDTKAFLISRMVPAVTGAFISADRSWFEKLGGFSLEYVFGHYEDADLCLKSLSAGRPVWVHPVPFWHLEGKGSIRRHVHEGGSTVNRWHFTQLWGDFIASNLTGRAPSRLKMP